MVKDVRTDTSSSHKGKITYVYDVEIKNNGSSDHLIVPHLFRIEVQGQGGNKTYTMLGPRFTRSLKSCLLNPGEQTTGVISCTLEHDQIPRKIRYVNPKEDIDISVSHAHPTVWKSFTSAAPTVEIINASDRGGAGNTPILTAYGTYDNPSNRWEFDRSRTNCKISVSYANAIGDISSPSSLKVRSIRSSNSEFEIVELTPTPPVSIERGKSILFVIKVRKSPSINALTGRQHFVVEVSE